MLTKVGLTLVVICGTAHMDGTELLAVRVLFLTMSVGILSSHCVDYVTGKPLIDVLKREDYQN